jgi:hypothetical protein
VIRAAGQGTSQGVRLARRAAPQRDHDPCNATDEQKEQEKDHGHETRGAGVPVADVDRARRFYEALGFRLDIDYVAPT